MVEIKYCKPCRRAWGYNEIDNDKIYHEICPTHAGKIRTVYTSGYNQYKTKKKTVFVKNAGHVGGFDNDY